MSKPLSKKIEKRVKKGAKSVEKSIKDLTRSADVSSKAAIAGAAVVGAAGIAAAALHLLRKGPRDAATFHVVAEEEGGWAIRADGAEDALETFRTKRSAVKTARKVAAEAAPSELLIHGRDGGVLKSHSYEPS